MVFMEEIFNEEEKKVFEGLMAFLNREKQQQLAKRKETRIILDPISKEEQFNQYRSSFLSKNRVRGLNQFNDYKTSSVVLQKIRSYTYGSVTGNFSFVPGIRSEKREGRDGGNFYFDLYCQDNLLHMLPKFALTSRYVDGFFPCVGYNKALNPELNEEVAKIPLFNYRKEKFFLKDVLRMFFDIGIWIGYIIPKNMVVFDFHCVDSFKEIYRSLIESTLIYQTPNGFQIWFSVDSQDANFWDVVQNGGLCLLKNSYTANILTQGSYVILYSHWKNRLHSPGQDIEEFFPLLFDESVFIASYLSNRFPIMNLTSKISSLPLSFYPKKQIQDHSFNKAYEQPFFKKSSGGMDRKTSQLLFSLEG